MKRKIILTGASGGLGSALMAKLSQHHDVLGLCHANPAPGLKELDLREPAAIQKLAKEFQPEIILHTVGLTDVDRCDRDLEAALDINTRSTLHARLAAEAVGARIIHISTNDVFSGEQGLYREQDIPLPVNFYSQTKYMAEQMLYGYQKSLILRFTILSWYASGKTTFAAWLVKSLRAGKPVSLYGDQYNSPLYVETLAEWIEALFDANGLYHLGSERWSRWQTGMAIAQAFNLDTSLIQKTSAVLAHTPAPRPLDVSLDCSKLKADWGLTTTALAEVKRLADAIPDHL